MDSTFNFLSDSDRELLKKTVSRRNPELLTRISRSLLLSHSDAQELIATISDELTDNLDDEWEPTEYGRRVSEILAHVNAARIAEWP